MRGWDALAIHADDNVAVVLEDIAAGAIVRVAREENIVSLTAAEAIPLGHKLALQPLAAGAPIVKYGEVIGTARAPIAQGHHVHVHNLASQRARKA